MLLLDGTSRVRSREKNGTSTPRGSSEGTGVGTGVDDATPVLTPTEADTRPSGVGVGRVSTGQPTVSSP